MTHAKECIVLFPPVEGAVGALRRRFVHDQRGPTQEDEARTISLRCAWQKRASLISTEAAAVSDISTVGRVRGVKQGWGWLEREQARLW